MYTVIETDEFSHWLGGLKDRTTRIRLARRLTKARQARDIERAKQLAKELS